MKRTFIALMLLSLASCTKEIITPAPDPVIITKYVEVPPKRDTVILNTKWYSYEVKDKVGDPQIYFMMDFSTQNELKLFFSFDRKTQFGTNELKVPYKYKYPKFVLIEKTGLEATEPYFKGFLVNDTTMTFYNKVFYKVLPPKF
jgi:hypothetical protein